MRSAAPPKLSPTASVYGLGAPTPTGPGLALRHVAVSDAPPRDAPRDGVLSGVDDHPGRSSPRALGDSGDSSPRLVGDADAREVGEKTGSGDGGSESPPMRPTGADMERCRREFRCSDVASTRAGSIVPSSAGNSVSSAASVLGRGAVLDMRTRSYPVALPGRLPAAADSGAVVSASPAPDSAAPAPLAAVPATVDGGGAGMGSDPCSCGTRVEVNADGGSTGCCSKADPWRLCTSRSTSDTADLMPFTV